MKYAKKTSDLYAIFCRDDGFVCATLEGDVAVYSNRQAAMKVCNKWNDEFGPKYVVKKTNLYIAERAK